MSKWLSWCGQRKNSVKMVEADIPPGIMPNKINASLIDIKIGGKRGPDDALYNKSQVDGQYNRAGNDDELFQCLRRN